MTSILRNRCTATVRRLVMRSSSVVGRWAPCRLSAVLRRFQTSKLPSFSWKSAKKVNPHVVPVRANSTSIDSAAAAPDLTTGSAEHSSVTRVRPCTMAMEPCPLGLRYFPSSLDISASARHALPLVQLSPDESGRRQQRNRRVRDSTGVDYKLL